jgi:hypothetical protein
MSSTQGFLGEHISLPKYDIKYENHPNVSEIRHILSRESKSNSNFETTMRTTNGFSEKTNKLERGFTLLTIKPRDGSNNENEIREKMKKRKEFKPPAVNKDKD